MVTIAVIEEIMYPVVKKDSLITTRAVILSVTITTGDQRIMKRDDWWILMIVTTFVMTARDTVVQVKHLRSSSRTGMTMVVCIEVAWVPIGVIDMVLMKIASRSPTSEKMAQTIMNIIEGIIQAIDREHRTEPTEPWAWIRKTVVTMLKVKMTDCHLLRLYRQWPLSKVNWPIRNHWKWTENVNAMFTPHPDLVKAVNQSAIAGHLTMIQAVVSVIAASAVEAQADVIIAIIPVQAIDVGTVVMGKLMRNLCHHQHIDIRVVSAKALDVGIGSQMRMVFLTTEKVILISIAI
jgi:hypothetical protein